MRPTSPEIPFDAGGRFSIERLLGEGAYGVVYRAFDHQNGRSVALKALRHATPDAIYRIKHEFRALADLSHRNLVSLYELLAVGSQWFFTMELIDGGSDFLLAAGRDITTGPRRLELSPQVQDDTASMAWAEHDTVRADALEVWTDARLDRLRELLAQLAEGLAALHLKGKLHRDIKPSNVMVTRESRVVLLDFGLVTELELPSGPRSAHIAGTPAYMSPEQCQSIPLTAASDWYSTGVMLYQVLTGRLPFDGSWHEMLHQKTSVPPAPIRDRARGVPRELEDLCVRLLDPDPAKRPGSEEVLVFARRTGTRTSVTPVPRRQDFFVGRKDQLEILREAFLRSRTGRLSAAFVSGPSGIGKTALVQHFLDEFRDDPEAMVVSGRCYERESVPYKAIDSLVDTLSRYLRPMSRSEAEIYLPGDIAVLARLFPVLNRVDAIASAPVRIADFPDSHEMRRRAFGALRELLARLADRKKVILFVDDMHWGDVDSSLILRKLFATQDPPSLLLITAFRTDDLESSPIMRNIVRSESHDRVDVRRLELHQLPASEALEMATAMIGDRERAAAVAQDSAGNPLFICALVDHALRSDASSNIHSLDDVIRVRLSRLPQPALAVARMIAVAGRPIETNVAFEAASLDPDPRYVSLLRGENLIRNRPSSEHEQVEIFHDRVRATIIEELSSDELRSCHRALAGALERTAGVDPEALAQHYLGAGERHLAARYSATAAARASEAFAFERAVALYRLAIDVTDPADAACGALYQRLGDTLTNTGRGAEAAEAYLRGVPFAGIELFLELHRKAAEQLLRSGHFERGLDTIRIVLGRLRMPLARTGKGALIGLLYRRLKLRLRGLKFEERQLSDISADDVLRIDTCWPITVGLLTVDTIRGVDFQTRHLLLALRAGEPYRIVRALAMEVAYSSASGGRSRARTEQVSQMTMALAKRINHPHAIGLAMLTSGMGAFCEGRWRKAYELCSESEQIFREHCTGVSWERDNAQLFTLGSLFFLGDIKELSKRLPALVREAEDRGDLYAQANLRIGFGFFSQLPWLAADDPGRAESELDAALSAWSMEAYNLQQYWARGGRIDIALYRGEDVTSFTRIPKRWRSLSRSFARHIQINLLVALHSRARRMLSAAQRSSHPQPLLDAALRDATRIENERMSWAMPWAFMVRASLAMFRGNRNEALALLASAESGLEAHDMGMYAAVVKRRRGLLLGNGGTELAGDAEAIMQQQTIKRPDRIEAVLLPGPWDSCG